MGTRREFLRAAGGIAALALTHGCSDPVYKGMIAYLLRQQGQNLELSLEVVDLAAAGTRSLRSLYTSHIGDLAVNGNDLYIAAFPEEILKRVSVGTGGVVDLQRDQRFAYRFPSPLGDGFCAASLRESGNGGAHFHIGIVDDQQTRVIVEDIAQTQYAATRRGPDVAVAYAKQRESMLEIWKGIWTPENGQLRNDQQVGDIPMAPPDPFKPQQLFLRFVGDALTVSDSSIGCLYYEKDGYLSQAVLAQDARMIKPGSYLYVDQDDRRASLVLDDGSPREIWRTGGMIRISDIQDSVALLTRRDVYGTAMIIVDVYSQERMIVPQKKGMPFMPLFLD